MFVVKTSDSTRVLSRCCYTVRKIYATILTLKPYSNELQSIQIFHYIFASNFASISIAELSSRRHNTACAVSTEVLGPNWFIQFGESACVACCDTLAGGANTLMIDWHDSHISNYRRTKTDIKFWTSGLSNRELGILFAAHYNYKAAGRRNNRIDSEY